MLNILTEDSSWKDFLYYLGRAKKARRKSDLKFYLSEIQPILFMSPDETKEYLINNHAEFIDYYINKDGHVELDEITVHRLISEFGKIDGKSEVDKSPVKTTDVNTYLVNITSVGDIKNTILTKDSNEQQIKTYFNNLKKLRDNGSEFPVDLDMVWMLLYNRKDSAIKDLKRNYTQDVDYQVLRQMAENLNGGRPVEKIYLSVSCLEFFVANKRRDIFNIYKEAFWATVNNKTQTQQPKIDIKTEIRNSVIEMIPEVIRETIKAVQENANLISQTRQPKLLPSPRIYKPANQSDWQKESIQSFASELGITYNELCDLLVNSLFVKNGRGSVLLPRIKFVREGLFRIETNDNEQRLGFSTSGKWKIKEMVNASKSPEPVVIIKKKNDKFDPLNCV